MASGKTIGFTRAIAEEAGAAEQINQLIAAHEGDTDRGVPHDLTEVEHATKYALDVRNKETDSSLLGRFRNAANEVVMLIVKAAVTIGKPTTFSDTVTFQGSLLGIPDDFLSADATGWNMMQDGFLAANATAQAKMADGFLSADEVGRAKMEDGFVTAAKVAADVATQAELDTHTGATTGIHGATATATANKLLIRDAAGRGKVVAPSAAEDIALKSTVDTHAALTDAHGSTLLATPWTLMRRDSGGRSKAGAPAAADDIALKSTVDAVQTNLNTHKTSSDHDGRYFTETEQDARFAPIAKGVTNGDSHDHAGGDGAQIPLAGHANDSVDDTKVGNRVPQFYRRQGGHDTIWSTFGTTTYTPTAVRMQGGVARWTGEAAAEGSITVTFPVAFAYSPIVFATAQHGDRDVAVTIQSVVANQVVLRWEEVAATTTTAMSIHWLAIGPE